MTSTKSILSTLERLIQRINKITLCQEHLTLISIALTQLQHTLNTTNIENKNRTFQDIVHTLKVIDEVIIGCTENEAELKGMTYRDLESLLLRLQLRLAQHIVDLTNNYEAKIEILTNACHDQQILVRKVFDEKIREKLDIIEKRTEERTIEQLRLLCEKHFHTIKVYLHCCIELHKSVPVTGLNGDIIAKIAHKFYKISSEDQSQLEHKWKSCDLPLTRTFIQFKPDKSTSFERNQSRKLLIGSESQLFQDHHDRTEICDDIWQRLVSTPYMMSMTERDRYSKEEDDDVTEENIIRSKRWIVILGDPGSGKTSFSRWLVCHLAQTLLLNGQHSTDYGPLRIPILIRIGEFAEILKEQSSINLFDYIGKHKWIGKSIVNDLSISLDNLSCTLQDYIKQGQALIILDGLDEIPISDQRSKIINLVENFVDTYVQTPMGSSAFDDPYLNKLFDNPSKSGGNQLIVTSRIVGYHVAPLAGQFAHYTIRPMNIEHMKDFVDYWFFRVHQHILDTLNLSLINQGENHSEALKKELEKNEHIGLVDVASNSCLMSFICCVAFSQLESSPLPTQRILLYETIVNSMLNLWSSKRSTIPIQELIEIFSNIASYIHGNSASGLIHEKKMKEICIQSIKESLDKNSNTKENIQYIENQACEFVRIIREDIGILAARGESLYGFLHLTFQEYFTCLKLINIETTKQEKEQSSKFNLQNKVQLVAQSIRYHIYDPRFQVPIALALGKISSSWSQKDFDNFCYQLIKNQDESDFLLPYGAYMLISCSNDLVNYPSHDVLFDVLDCLIIAAGQHKWSIVCPFLFDQIIISLKKLRHDIVSLWINKLLSQSSRHNIQTISALCHLLEGKSHEFENIKWLNQSSCSILQSLLILDNENNGFTIDRLLVKITFFNHRLLPINLNTFKGFLLDQEIEFNSIPFILFPIIISLYGGLKRDDSNIVFDPFYIYRESTVVTPILIHFLSRNNLNKQNENITMIKQEFLRLLLTRIENQNESCETIDLCIVIICLYGIDYVKNNLKIISSSLLHMSIHRLKYISMILRQFYFAGDRNDPLESKKVTNFISSIIEKFQYSQSSKLQYLNLLNALRTSMARLRFSVTSMLIEGTSNSYERVTINLPNSLRKNYKCLDYILSIDTQFYFGQKSCSLIDYFTRLFWILENSNKFSTRYRMSVALNEIPKYLLFRNDEDLLFSLTFIPTHLRNLYLQLLKKEFIMIHSKDCTVNKKEHFFFGHILLECLILLSNTSCKRRSLMGALITLLPMLRMHHLENFGSTLLWTLATKDSWYLSNFEIIRQHPMNYTTGMYINKNKNFYPGYDMRDEERRILIKKCIEQEQQRLQNALADCNKKCMELYSACISLARTCRWTQDNNRLTLLEQSVHGALSIDNKLVRLDALCIIGLYSDSDHNQIKTKNGISLQKEIELQLHDIYSDISLLLHTAVFIRCLPLLEDQQTMNKCLQNLLDKLINAQQRDQQVVYEALFPYFESNFTFSSILKQISNSFVNYNKTVNNKSSVIMEYINDNSNENLSSTVLVSNLYLAELTSDVQKLIAIDDLSMIISHSNLPIIDNSIASRLFQFEGPILTFIQVFTITNIIVSNYSIESEKLYAILNNALHYFDFVEFKACRLLESWMKWKNSNKLSPFAWHAALILVNSDLWSVEAAIIVCDLLCNENDRFRQRAEIIFRSESDDHIRTGSNLGIDVLLALVTRKAHYQHISPSVNLTLYRMFENLTVDIESHLETLLWFERYRIHALVNKEVFLINRRFSSISPISSHFRNDFRIDVTFCDGINRMSNDLVHYMCNLITSNFLLFLDIDGDTTSNGVLESHTQFIISVFTYLISLIQYNNEVRSLMIDTLMTLFETSENNEIRRVAVHALSYVCDKNTYKFVFAKLQTAVAENNASKTLDQSDDSLSSLISSYCHCVSINNIVFDQDDMNVFRKLLKYSSPNVLRAVHVGLGRVLQNTSLLFEMLDLDYIQCYHALMESTAYLFLYNVRRSSADTAAAFVEEHFNLLPIIVVNLYNSVRHFTNEILHVRTVDYYLAHGYPRYVEIAGLIAMQMPAAFCAYVNDWQDGDNLKRALFYTSKQHNFSQRAACLTILSIFGELTIELCEMFIEALRDDPHIQNTCYKCLTRINFIKDEEAVLNKLFFYLKSKSMNVRYITAKIFLHLSKSSLISSRQVQIVLNDLILDPSSNESLWLIRDQDLVQAECVYNYVGPLKDVVYSLLIQHLAGDATETIQRNELNDIDASFAESETAARFSSCLYEAKTEENLLSKSPSKKVNLDN